MSRGALISRNIVVDKQFLNRSAVPIYGIILIEDDLIIDVIHASEEIPVETLAYKYSEYYPQIYENSFISPGIIDLNTRREWQDISQYTQQAVKGGVSLVLEESGIFTNQERQGEMYCDVGYVETIDITMVGQLRNIAKLNPLAFKGYLYPPSNQVKCLPNNLEVVFKELQELAIPLMLDVNFPDPRMHYVTSPCHQLSLQERENFELERNDGIFAAAFPYNINDEESNESTPSIKEQFGDETVGRLERTMSNVDEYLPKFQVHLNKSKRRQSFFAEEESTEQIVEFSFKKYKTLLQRRKSYDLFRDLDRRISLNENAIENLSRAEMNSYQFDRDAYSHRRSRSFQLQSDVQQLQGIIQNQQPNSQTPQNASRLQLLRPPQITLMEFKPAPKDIVYINYLANCPDKWEMQGVEKVIKCYDISNCRLHISNLSSAGAIRLLRKSREMFKNLTCETSAHYLRFHSEMIQDKATQFKDFPPIRNSTNNSLLLECLKLKLIDSVSSKHALINTHYKYQQEGSFKRALNGVNTQGYTLQSLWTHFYYQNTSVCEQNQWIVKISKWLSSHPAKILQLSDRGSIERGKLADLIVWNPYEKVTADSDSIFCGQNLYGRIIQVYIRGDIAYEKGVYEACGKRIYKMS